MLWKMYEEFGKTLNMIRTEHDFLWRPYFICKYYTAPMFHNKCGDDLYVQNVCSMRGKQTQLFNRNNNERVWPWTWDEILRCIKLHDEKIHKDSLKNTNFSKIRERTKRSRNETSEMLIVYPRKRNVHIHVNRIHSFGDQEVLAGRLGGQSQN